jgi:hypothetical protein
MVEGRCGAVVGFFGGLFGVVVVRCIICAADDFLAVSLLLGETTPYCSRWLVGTIAVALLLPVCFVCSPCLFSLLVQPIDT